MRVNPGPLLIALSAGGLITSEQEVEMKDAKLPREAKIDPELPESLAPRSRERKQQLLRFRERKGERRRVETPKDPASLPLQFCEIDCGDSYVKQ
jgi:hypothetical protein